MKKQFVIYVINHYHDDYPGACIMSQLHSSGLLGNIFDFKQSHDTFEQAEEEVFKIMKGIFLYPRYSITILPVYSATD